MYNTNDFRGEVRKPVRILNQEGDALYQTIKDELPNSLQQQGIPAATSDQLVKSGGLFGSKFPMLLVRHPNPPTRFFDIGIVVNQNIVSFQLLGESAQNTKANKLEDLRAQGKLVRSWLVKPDEFILQQEAAWQAEIMDAFDSIFTPR